MGLKGYALGAFQSTFPLEWRLMRISGGMGATVRMSWERNEYPGERNTGGGCSERDKR